MDFANPAGHENVLEDFDFDSFLMPNGPDQEFQFNADFGIDGEIGVNEQ